MSQKRILTMAANRSIYIDQSQSLNRFIGNANKSKVLAAHLYGWKLGLKTGMYYLRTRSAVDPLKGLGIDTSITKPINETQEISNTNHSNNDEEKLIEMVMMSRPSESPFECEGCGS